ncbi:MAG TPA: [LysW]-aminoadipate kinase [Candidatus Deferrimicrobium sp.]|nr:[LysW]-aminoadipate kinase [Candidatus Deferrimicrobium sp.]
MLIVIKLGGRLLAQDVSLKELFDDIAHVCKNHRLVVCHGGGPQIDDMLSKIGKEPIIIQSASGVKSRMTDKDTLIVAEMVMAGKINKELVSELLKRGVNAVGISGIDGNTIQSKKKDKLTIFDPERNKKRIIRGDNSGKIEKVDPRLLNLLLDNGYTPVIAPITASEEMDPLNTDGDRTAVQVASALHADKLVLFTDVEGVLKEGNLVPKIGKEEIKDFFEYVKGGMKKKIYAAREALEAGIVEVIVSSGLIQNPISNAVEGKVGTSFSYKYL